MFDPNCVELGLLNISACHVVNLGGFAFATTITLSTNFAAQLNRGHSKSTLALVEIVESNTFYVFSKLVLDKIA